MHARVSMMYDQEFWDRYADENEARYNEEFARFVSGLATSLGCSTVLEVGCGTGIDLRLFPEEAVHGIDPNERALGIARQKMPGADFGTGDITRLPFEDSSIDLVFTHQLLNYLDDDALEKGISEMHRVASKYVMSCEKFADGEPDIDGRHKFRDIRKRWAGYDVRMVSNVDMHGEIEPDRARFTLVKKL